MIQHTRRTSCRARGAQRVTVIQRRATIGKVPEQPRMNKDPAFVAGKLGRVHDAHVQPLNALVEAWRREGRDVPWADPDLGGIYSRILFLRESPAPPPRRRIRSHRGSPQAHLSLPIAWLRYPSAVC